MLPLVAPEGNWSQKALLDLPDVLEFNLFDKVNKSFADERDSSVRTVAEEARWLGSFSLPFATIYRNTKLEGVFPLEVPPLLLGYDKDADSASSGLMPAAALLFKRLAASAGDTGGGRAAFPQSRSY